MIDLRATRRSLIASLVLIASAVSAADYPSRTIKIVVPGAAAGATDVFARIVAPSLAEQLGVPVIVENRPTGAGVIGAAAVAQAEPDGYTLLFTGSDLMSLVANLRDDLPYDTAVAFTPIAMVGEISVVFAVNPNVPAKSLQELVALAKQKPGAIRFATGGVASTPHVVVERFKELTGINIEHVPYRGGGQAATAAVSGEVEMVAAAAQAVAALSQTGKLRAIAVSASKRLAAAPDLPTMIEAGQPDMAASAWFGFFGPARLPDALRERIAAAIQKVSMNSEFQRRLQSIGVESAPSMSGQPFAAFVAEDRARWRDVIRRAGITIQ